MFERINEQEKNKKVLLSCIDEIDKTEPFFISMLGNRYGWIPQHDDIDITFQSEDAKEFYDKSVTQIEIEHALMKFKDCSRCLFLFRSDENSCDDDERLKKYCNNIGFIKDPIIDKEKGLKIKEDQLTELCLSDSQIYKNLMKIMTTKLHWLLKRIKGFTAKSAEKKLALYIREQIDDNNVLINIFCRDASIFIRNKIKSINNKDIKFKIINNDLYYIVKKINNKSDKYSSLNP